MKHRIGFNRLGMKPSHRQSMTRNMVTSLFRHERIRTTLPKAKAIRRVAEKMITRAKTDTVHNRRMINRDIKDKAILSKLFTDIGPRFHSRPGGYTRIFKLEPRKNDGAEMALLELVEKSADISQKGKKNKKKKSEVS